MSEEQIKPRRGGYQERSLKDALRDPKFIAPLIGVLCLCVYVPTAKITRTNESKKPLIVGRVVGYDFPEHSSTRIRGRTGAQAGAVRLVIHQLFSNPVPVEVTVETPSGETVVWKTSEDIGNMMTSTRAAGQLTSELEIYKEPGERKPYIWSHGKQMKGAGLFKEDDRERPAELTKMPVIAKPQEQELIAESQESTASPAPPVLTPEEKFQQSELLVQQASQYWRAGNTQEAVRCAEQCLALRSELYGDPNHPKIVEIKKMIAAAQQ